MIKAVIFDLDGTLLDTLEDLTDSVNYALETNGISACSLEQVKGFVGNGIEVLIDKAVDAMKTGTSKEIKNRILVEFKNHYTINCNNKTKPYKGILELLRALKEMEIMLAIVSNKFDAAVKSLARQYFDKLIDYGVGEDISKGLLKKPSPAMIESIMKKCGLSNDEVIYVGDSEVDIETAKNAQIKCVSVAWGFRERDFLISKGVSTIIDKPHEMLDILKAI